MNFVRVIHAGVVALPAALMTVRPRVREKPQRTQRKKRVMRKCSVPCGRVER
jgi:hypothetical protein